MANQTLSFSSIDESRSIHIEYKPSVRTYHQVIAELANKYTPSGRLLDIGCGTGSCLSLIKQYTGNRLELYGSDIDDKCLALTQERVPSVHTIKMSDNGFDSESLGSNYDTCLLSHVLEHVLYPLDTLKKILSIIKPHGHLILATPNPIRPGIIINSLVRRHYVNRGHVHAWDRSHWINFLENIAKVHVVEYPVDELRIVPVAISNRVRPIQQFQRGLAKAIPWWSFSNIAVIRND